MNLEVRCSSRISGRAPGCPGEWGGGSARRSQRGLITKPQIANAVIEELAVFSD